MPTTTRRFRIAVTSSAPAVAAPAAGLLASRFVRFPLVVAATLLISSVPGITAAAAVDRTEAPVVTSSPVTTVAESVVRVRVPLPDSAGPHPEACDWLSYLRYRDAAGPADAARADRILIAQPGVLEGAGAFDNLARHTVRNAARQGRHIEFWALDRRSNCLEDHTGLAAGLAARDPHVAVDYYYRGAEVDGRRFAGYLGNDRLDWLAHLGLEQTLRDQYDLMVRELPDPAVRASKVLCGGHSLGGTLTGFFASWDFDGTPGHTQCAGYFALDSAISTSLGSLSGLPDAIGADDLGYAATHAGLASGLLPRALNLPVLINAETMNLLGVAGLAADVDPDGPSDLASYLPSNANLETTDRLLFSRDAVAFATGIPSIWDFAITNATALGALLDDNSQPLAFLQASTGFFGGGPVADKDFPLPHEPAGTTGALGVDPLAVPVDPSADYTWRDYDDIDATVARDRHGAPFTTPAKEVTAIADLARSLAEHPLDFTEQYFPSKLVTDISQAGAAEIRAHVRHPEGITAHPTINLLAGDGLIAPRGEPATGETVLAPGYQHLDVLTAAARRNTGEAEPVAANLTRFALG